MQEIKVFGLRELPRFGDALGEDVPGNDGLDCGKRVATRLFSVEQSLADLPVQAHLFVDGLAGCLKLLLMPVLGNIEKLAQDAVVKIDDFICHIGHAFDGQCDEGGIALL